jgi:hypothetical protein
VISDKDWQPAKHLSQGCSTEKGTQIADSDEQSEKADISIHEVLRQIQPAHSQESHILQNNHSPIFWHSLGLSLPHPPRNSSWSKFRRKDSHIFKW